MTAEPYHDAQGTDGSDPTQVFKVYPDGTRIVTSDVVAIAAKDAQWAQSAQAHTSLQAILGNLESLSAEDAAYALMGRAMARKDGASQATIDGIVSRATAVAYLQGKTEWVNLPAAAKAWLADHLDMEAVLFQVIIITLRR